MAKITDADRLNWLEREAKQGACPGLVSDDNGHWAVSFVCFQDIATGGPKDVSTTFFVTAKEWKRTVRAAIDAAMKPSKKTKKNT